MFSFTKKYARMYLAFTILYQKSDFNKSFSHFFVRQGKIMKIVGIICEYNPLHHGHRKQIDWIRGKYGEDCAIVCLMSGNYVQRGLPAVFPKMTRAEAALRCGADLVLELPVTYVLSSAEGFASGGVSILGKLCDELCFGSETGTERSLMDTAESLLSPAFCGALRTCLDEGLSFPAARQKALAQQGTGAELLSSPNDILGVEYCKAILAQNCSMKPLVIRREGSYHDEFPDKVNPSATSLRNLLAKGLSIAPYIPEDTAALYRKEDIHTLKAGERAMLMRLRTMCDAEFEEVPYGSEGLWRKLMHESRRQATLEEILTAVKSKRYTRSRIDRMVMCAFLGLTQRDLATPAPYARILGFSARGRQVLRAAREQTTLYNVGVKTDDPFWEIEQRCTDLYALFRETSPDIAGSESKCRIINQQTLQDFHI